MGHPHRRAYPVWRSKPSSRTQSLYGAIGESVYAVSRESGEILWRKDKFDKDLAFVDIPRRQILSEGPLRRPEAIFLFGQLF